jgi:Fe2+ transport system protein FeoA
MAQTTLIPLIDAPVGALVRISRLNSHPELCSRLRELGLSENTIIRTITKGSGNIICEVYNTRLGLNEMLARSIVVSAV